MKRITEFAYEAAWQIKQRCVQWLVSRGLVESFSVILARQLNELQIKYVLDVGANRGQFARQLRRLGYSGRIISFEPVAATFHRLSEVAAKDPLWEIHNLALGACAGETQINVTQSDDFSSLLEPNEHCEKIFSEQTARRETISVRRLDEILPRLIPPSEWPFLHLKLDTQGFDLEVMKGLGSCIEQIRSLQTELSVIGLYEGQPGYLEVLAFLNCLGFCPSSIHPVSRHLGLPIVEFDALFLRSDHIKPHRAP